MSNSDIVRAIDAWADAMADTEDGDSTNRRWEAVGKCEMCFLLSGIASLIILVTLDLYCSDIKNIGYVVCFSVLLIQAVFCGYFLVHGVRAERPYEMICFSITYLLMIVNITTSILNYCFQGEIAALATVGLGWIFFMVFGLLYSMYYITGYFISGNLIKRTIINLVDLESKVATVYCCKALLALNLMFGMVVTALICLSVDKYYPLWISICVAVGLLVSCGYASAGVFFMTHETRCCMFWIILLALAQQAMVVVAIYDAYNAAEIEWFDGYAGQSLVLVTYINSILASVVAVLLIGTYVSVYFNFGYGVNTLVFRKTWKGTVDSRDSSINRRDMESYNYYGSTCASAGTSSMDSVDEALAKYNLPPLKDGSVQ